MLRQCVSRNWQVPNKFFCRSFSAEKSKSKNNKYVKEKASGAAMKQAESLEKFYETANAANRLKIKFTEEEQKEHYAIGREYNSQNTRKHNQDQKDLANKVWLQHEALRALPPHLHASAIILDETPPPKNRPFPVFHTPPIPGFNVYDYVPKEDKNKKAGENGEEGGDEEEDVKSSSYEDEEEEEDERF